MARVAGFEPADHGVRIRCLTAWLYPNKAYLLYDKAANMSIDFNHFSDIRTFCVLWVVCVASLTDETCVMLTLLHVVVVFVGICSRSDMGMPLLLTIFV